MSLEEMQRQVNDLAAQADASLAAMRRMVESSTVLPDRLAEIDRKIDDIAKRVKASETTTKLILAMVKAPDDDDGE